MSQKQHSAIVVTLCVNTLRSCTVFPGIGERKLQQIADENRDTGFVIYNGVKLLFKREKFAAWLNETNAI